MLMSVIFFFNDTATTEIYTLSLHDALPISARAARGRGGRRLGGRRDPRPALALLAQAQLPRAPLPRQPALRGGGGASDRKSTRLNSSHANISYAVFCLKKKKETRHVLASTS